MATLHLLSHSPFDDSRMSSCLRLLGNEDAVLLSGDAVSALIEGCEPCLSLQRSGAAVFALDEDLSARGLSAPPWVTSVDYSVFVELTLRYQKVNSWL